MALNVPSAESYDKIPPGWGFTHPNVVGVAGTADATKSKSTSPLSGFTVILPSAGKRIPPIASLDAGATFNEYVTSS